MPERHCDECGIEVDALNAVVRGPCYLCPLCDQRLRREYEPVPYPDADELAEDQRLV